MTVSSPSPSHTPIEKAPEPQEEKALTAASDPDWKMPSIDLLEKKQSPSDAGNTNQNANNGKNNNFTHNLAAHLLLKNSRLKGWAQ